MRANNQQDLTRGKSGIPVPTNKVPKNNNVERLPIASDSSKENGVSHSANSSSPSKGLTRRDQVMKMRESRIREEEINLTFKPAIQTRGRDTNTVATNSSRFDKLYEEAKLRKEKVKHDEKPSFKPKITSLGQSKQRSQTPEGTTESLYHSSGAGRKKEEPKADKIENFNFQPKISKRGKSLDRNRDVSPSTRLYTQAQIFQMKLTKKQEAKLQEEVKDCTFTPQTNPRVKNSSHSSDQTSDVTARMERYQQLREKRIEELKKIREAEDALVTTFKPTSYTSNHKAQRSSSRERGDVFSRLHETPRKASETAEQEWEKEHTFRPTLVSHRAPSPLPGGHEGYTSVHEKLYVQGNQRKKELELEKEELRKELEKDLTFTPQVTHRESSSGDAKGPVFERLSASRQYVHEILTQIKTEFEMDECTFRPQINPVSESLARHSREEPVHLRLASDAERLRVELEKRRQQKLEEEIQQCTFSPTLSTAFNKEGSFKVREKDVFDRLTESLPRPPSQHPFSPPLPPSKSANGNKTPNDSQPVFIKRAPKREVSTSEVLPQSPTDEGHPVAQPLVEEFTL